MELLNPLSGVDFPSQTAAFSGTAGTVTGWNSGPEGVLVWSDQPCYVAVGVGAVATVADTPIPAFTPIPFKAPLLTSGVWTVSAIQVGVAGNVYCKPINSK